MKSLKFFTLMLMIWSAAVFIRFAPVRPIFEEKPFVSLLIFIVASLAYKLAPGDD